MPRLGQCAAVLRAQGASDNRKAARERPLRNRRGASDYRGGNGPYGHVVEGDLPQQFEIGKTHLPRRWPGHGSTQQTRKCRPQANRSALNPAHDDGRLFGVVANHLSNERHRASYWQAKLAAEKRRKCRFCRTILPFATETS